MASPETTMSQEEKEAQLNNRIEEIRRKNAALQKRYDEVQADKKNADGVEARSRPPSNRPPREIKERKQRLPIAQRLGAVIKPDSTSTSRGEQRQQRLKQEDGPPPDPSYSFLADRTRDREKEVAAEKETIKDKQEEQQQQQLEEPKDRREGSRRHPSNYGGKDFSNAKIEMKKRRSYEKNAAAFQRRSTNSKMEMELSMTGRERSDYERWRYERKGIDEARVNRQRTTSGEWGRQWDKEKDFSKDAPVEPTAAAWKQSKKQESGSKKSPIFHDSRPTREDDDFGHLDHEKEDKESGKSTQETEKEAHSPLNRSVDVSNDTLSVSFTNELATSPKATQMSDDHGVQATVSPELPPAPPIPPRVTRGWGSDDAWEDASPWEDCDEEHSQELVDDTFDREEGEDGDDPEVTATIYETRSAAALETDDDLVCKSVDMAPPPFIEMVMVATDSCICNDASGLPDQINAEIEPDQMQKENELVQIRATEIEPEVKTGSDDEYKEVESTFAPEKVNEVTDGDDDAALPVASLEDTLVLDAESLPTEERPQIESSEHVKVENLEKSL